jgi:hypothetical protein
MKPMTIVRRTDTKWSVGAPSQAQPVSFVLLAGEALLLTGCGGVPSITIAGAYFPAWLMCGLIAVILSIVVRGLMLATGLSSQIPYQLAVCISVGVIVGLLVWQFWMVH